MAAVLGKRKRRDRLESPPHEIEDDPTYNIRLQRLLQQNFETRFEPLESLYQAPTQSTFLEEDDERTDDDECDWTGFSEASQEGGDPVVVHHQKREKTRADISKGDIKLFMGSKPPLEDFRIVSSTDRKKTEIQDPEEAATDAANLKKDLALQRLLQESHLLDPRSSLTPSGQNRHKALDIRQQALGSKSSMFTQQKMPLAQRKGIIAKSAGREEKRRQEAKEGGIILEKAAKTKSKDPKRERGIGAPSVGKFSRGMLTLSKRDVTKIVGPSKRSRRR